MDIVYFILLIGPLVFVHELGHFAVAKAFRIKVVKFSLGFGPVMIGKQWGETFYQIAAIPLGGFVKFLGDDPREEVEPEDQRRTFPAAAGWKRALVIFAGPAMSLIFPIFCYFVVGLMVNELTAPTIGQVIPGTPADRAGLRAGDRIVRVEGTPIYGFEDLQAEITTRPEQDVDIVVQRGEEEVSLTIRPELVKRQRIRFRPLEVYEEVGLIGITPYYPEPVIGIPSLPSPAAEAGLQTFDLITSVNGQEVERWIEVERILSRIEPGQPVTVSYLRPQRRGWPFAEVFLQQPGTATIRPREGEDIEAAFGMELGTLYVSYVREGWPAHTAGIRPGDKIISLDGQDVGLWGQFVEEIRDAPTEPHRITLLRDGEERTVVLRIEPRMRSDRYLGEVVDYRIGMGVYDPVELDDRVPNPNRFARAAYNAVRETGEVIHFMGIAFVQIFQGRVSFQSVGGPIMLFEIAGTAGRQGAHSFLTVLALISINLGLLNLLPIPVLDGGHLLMIGVEAIRRKPLSLKAREVINIIGLALLILLMIFAFKNDIQRYELWDKVASWFSSLFSGD